VGWRAASVRSHLPVSVRVLIWVTPAEIMVKLAQRRVDGRYGAHHHVAHD
jgi:hypothetical protein